MHKHNYACCQSLKVWLRVAAGGDPTTSATWHASMQARNMQASMQAHRRLRPHDGGVLEVCGHVLEVRGLGRLVQRLVMPQQLPLCRVLLKVLL